MASLFDTSDPTSRAPKSEPANLWGDGTRPNGLGGGRTAPVAAPAASPLSLSSGNVHGLHGATLRHLGAHLHGLGAALDGMPHVIPPSPPGTVLHHPTVRAVHEALGRMAPAGGGPEMPSAGGQQGRAVAPGAGPHINLLG